MSTTPDSATSQIGMAAGNVWHTLEQQGAMSVTRLIKEVDQPRDLIMQAVGWLAREGKVEICENGRKRSITLR